MAHAPYLSRRTRLRLLVSDDGGLELLDLDSGRRRTLVGSSDANGDAWVTQRVSGGFIAQGYAAGSGAGTLKLNVWFIPDGAAPNARLLGPATGSLDEASGGVWLLDQPNNAAGFGRGTISLVTTSGRRIRTGSITCCQLVEASVGGGRFITATHEGDEGPPSYGYQMLHVYDAFSKRFIRTLTSPKIDAEFVGLEGGSVVWRNWDCPARCLEHVVDLSNGHEHLRREDDGTRSPDSDHVATELDSGRVFESGADHTLAIDGRPIADSDDAASGIEWSPDGNWLLFVRPDFHNFGIWAVGARSAETVRLRFYHLEEWAIFDQVKPATPPT